MISCEASWTRKMLKKTSKIILTLFDKFWFFFDVAPFRWPLLQSADLRTILSAVDAQTAILVSTAEVWISAPDT